MKNLKEIKLMMERLESPRLTNTELQRKMSLLKEDETWPETPEEYLEHIKKFLMKQFKNKGLLSSDAKKKYLEKFIKNQAPIGGPTTISPEEKMEIRTKAAQSFLDEL
jgi:hypothetical protein